MDTAAPGTKTDFQVSVQLMSEERKTEIPENEKIQKKSVNDGGGKRRSEAAEESCCV